VELGYCNSTETFAFGMKCEHCARLWLCWYNDRYFVTSLKCTHLLLVGSDTVPISIVKIFALLFLWVLCRGNLKYFH